MFLKVLRDIAKPQWFEIITHLKRSTGLSVTELAEAMKMSYMGVKQHCIELEKRGYLDTWRRPKAVGRPEKAYRLTHKADPLFPEVGNEFALALLESMGAVYGESAAEKLLFGYFQKKGLAYQKKIKGETLAERAAAFARVRNSEGYLAHCEGGDGAGGAEGDEDGEGLCIVEHHTPYGEMAAKYPILFRMEEQMFERVLGAPVEREVERASALLRFVFRLE